VDYVAVLTRTRGGVLVVGGFDPDTLAPTGEIWFSPLDGDRWMRLATAYVPERVLGASYSFASRELYVLDETAKGGERARPVPSPRRERLRRRTATPPRCDQPRPLARAPMRLPVPHMAPGRHEGGRPYTYTVATDARAGAIVDSYRGAGHPCSFSGVAERTQNNIIGYCV
jgi:hypothetical protein